MIRLAAAILVGLALIAFAALGWRGRLFTRPPITFWQDMTNQPRYEPQKASRFFADGRSQRVPPTGVVPWGYAAFSPDPTFARSDEDRYAMPRIPLPVDRELLARGRTLYEIQCAVCHGRTGAGNGITTQYGMNAPPTYHAQRLREASDGYLYQVITEGRNTMGPYGGRLAPDERWAIVAHLRVLQRAFNATLDDVPEAERSRLQETP